MISRGRMARTMPFFGGVELATCLWIACAILTLVASQQNFYPHGRYGKRQEPRAAAFMTGSRYGRSGMIDAKNTKMEPRLVQIAPRMDRFFLGSRYGKRVPLQYESASTLNRFSAVLDYIDHSKGNTGIQPDDYTTDNENDVGF